MSRKTPGFSASTIMDGGGSCGGRGSDSGPATDSQLRQRFPGLLLPAFSPGKRVPLLTSPFYKNIYSKWFDKHVQNCSAIYKNLEMIVIVAKYLQSPWFESDVSLSFFLHFAWICFGQVNVSCVCEEKTAAQDCICCIWCRYNICYTTLNCSSSDPD